MQTVNKVDPYNVGFDYEELLGSRENIDHKKSRASFETQLSDKLGAALVVDWDCPQTLVFEEGKRYTAAHSAIQEVVAAGAFWVTN